MSFHLPGLPVLLGDAAGAISFYTRLPMPLDGDRQRTFADTQWAAPLAGAVVGLGVGGALWLALLPGLPVQLAAAFAIAAGVALTGALHEDGLADTADGFGGGRTRDDKLAIMRDSRIGSYGVLAIGLSLLARWAALAALAEASIAGAVLASVAAHAGSRAVLPALLTALPPSRADGLSAGIGTISNGTALAALALGFVFLLPCGLAFAVVSSLVLGLVAFLVARLALAQIGGQTGDVLGCAQQAGEIALLSSATLFLLP